MTFNILNQYINSFLIFHWKDFLEILFFTSLVYYSSLWLRNDKQKNLLATFYLILCIFVGSHFAQMHTVTNFFVLFLPVIITIFYLVHQNTLQKNFIALKNISPAKPINNTIWIDEFMRSCLSAIGNNKQITAIIENKDSLNEFIATPFTIQTNINKDLIDILINSPSFDQQKMMWITWDGKLQAINSTWNIKNSDLWISDDMQTNDNWQQDAIIFTSKIDSLVFRSYPVKRTFDVVMQGKLIENITPNNFLNIIQHFTKKNEIELLKRKGQTNNEAKFKSSSSKQQPYA